MLHIPSRVLALAQVFRFPLAMAIRRGGRRGAAERQAASMERYSLWSLARNALSHHQNWQRAWRSPPLKAEYDVIIIGAGGHGLATAHRRRHWPGGG